MTWCAAAVGDSRAIYSVVKFAWDSMTLSVAAVGDPRSVYSLVQVALDSMTLIFDPSTISLHSMLLVVSVVVPSR